MTDTTESSEAGNRSGWRVSAAAFGVRAAALAGVAAAVGIGGVEALSGIFEQPDVAAFFGPFNGSTCCKEDSN